MIPIPTILKEIAESSKFIGVAGEYSIKTELLPILLNMHDYNHQNGTHRPLFEIAEVLFDKFILKIGLSSSKTIDHFLSQ